MKKKFVLSAILVLILVLTDCSNGAGQAADDEVILVGTFTGSKSGIDYSLTLSRVVSRAAVETAVNDNYELVLTKSGSVQKSSGKVVSVSAGILTLQPLYKDAPSFKVTVSGEKIASVTGTFTSDSGETMQGPGAFTPSGSGGGGGGGSGNAGGNAVTKTITITGLSGKTSGWIGLLSTFNEENTAAEAMGNVTNGSITFSLLDRNGGPWNGSGSYYLYIALDDGSEYLYTNGKTFAELGLVASSSDAEFEAKTPKYSITSASSMIDFTEFRNITEAGISVHVPIITQFVVGITLADYESGILEKTVFNKGDQFFNGFRASDSKGDWKRMVHTVKVGGQIYDNSWDFTNDFIGSTTIGTNSGYNFGDSGTYELTWYILDQAGNKSNVITRTITVN